MTWGRSPTEISGYRVLNDPFGHQKYFQPPSARNRPFWAFSRQISHFLYIFNIGRQDPVFGKIGIKSAGGPPRQKFLATPHEICCFITKKILGALRPVSGRFCRFFENRSSKITSSGKKSFFSIFWKSTFSEKSLRNFWGGPQIFCQKKLFFCQSLRF